MRIGAGPRSGVAAALTALVVAGCGVPAQDRAQVVPPAELPPELAASPGTPTRPRAAQVTVYLVQGSRLVRQEERTSRNDVAQALLALVAAGPRGARRSAGPAGTTVQRLQVRGDALTVDLSREFGEVRGADQVLAVAQVVWTATEFPTVRRVSLSVEGTRIDVPLPGGAGSRAAATREVYRALGPES